MTSQNAQNAQNAQNFIYPQPNPALNGMISPYPGVPFWTACPLPFAPWNYPQMVLPPHTLQQLPVGPELLRPASENLIKGQREIEPVPTDPLAKRASRQWASPSQYEEEINNLKLQLQASENTSRILKERLEASKEELKRLRKSGHISPPGEKDDMFIRTVMKEKQQQEMQQQLQGYPAHPGYYCLSPSPLFFNSWPSPCVEVPPQAFQEKIDFEKTRQNLRTVTKEVTQQQSQQTSQPQQHGQDLDRCRQEELRSKEMSTMINIKDSDDEAEDLDPRVEDTVIIENENGKYKQDVNQNEQSMGGMEHGFGIGGTSIDWIDEMLLSESLDKSLDIEELMDMDV
eukprot:TRINITY_DN5528_c0_g1_i1.p1 TRINITY_DN5528_c0_g1~~TRINITY_DN5528_c0_g1_i1.p1  ORF type:complete len:343 (+),score=84.54 TRINITY_DN5528_c0_g1_i1:85-1113(+)